MASPIWRSRRVFTLLSTNIPLRLQTLLQTLQLRDRTVGLNLTPSRSLAHERDGLCPPACLQHLKNLPAERDVNATPVLVCVERAFHRRETLPSRKHRPLAPTRLQERDKRDEREQDERSRQNYCRIRHPARLF